MANEQQINFKDIDYKGIKESLITFLQTTDEFKDANLEGTFISHLVNMLAYTGSLFGNYANSSASEQYISTCNLYETGNMLSQLIGYKAHGFISSKTTVVVEPDFESMGIDESIGSYEGWSAIIPENAQFSTSITNEKNKSLIFSNMSDAILNIKDPETSTEENINKVSLELIQGIPLSIKFISSGENLQSFELPNPYIDYREIKVYVRNDVNEEEKWTRVDTWFNNGPEDKVYVSRVNEKGLVEILFSEGNFGKVPPVGKNIVVTYLASQGADGKISANLIDNITDTIYFVNPNNQLDIIEGKFTITQESESSEGSNIETLDRIKRFAPLYYGMQNRLVTQSDYENFILGEYPFITDVKAFSYEEAIDVGIINTPCYNEFVNPRFSDYIEIPVVGQEENIKKPTNWGYDGFYDIYTIETGDIIPIPDTPTADDILNFGTSSALYVDSTKPCEDDQGALLQQRVDSQVSDGCCNIVHFEVEILNPNKNDETGAFEEIIKDDVSLYINGEQCFYRIDKFKSNSNGYNSDSCCCDREGNVDGWYVIKGAYILDNSIIDENTNTASLLSTIYIRPNRNFVLGECKVYIDNTRSSNDIFIVPVPTQGGYLNIETKEDILESMDKIDMVSVKNHIIAPIYQVFDVKVVYRKDETSILTLDDINNSIRSEINNLFLPVNSSLGNKLNTIDIANSINNITGVSRSRITLIPRSEDMIDRVNELGDYELLESEFPILGNIIIQ
jgi:hypothetical protein